MGVLPSTEGGRDGFLEGVAPEGALKDGRGQSGTRAFQVEEAEGGKGQGPSVCVVGGLIGPLWELGLLWRTPGAL